MIKNANMIRPLLGPVTRKSTHVHMAYELVNNKDASVESYT